MMQEMLGMMGSSSSSNGPDWKAFSLAEKLMTGIDASWEQRKDEGNAALKKKDYLAAAELYKQSYILALGALDGGMIVAFTEALETWPEGSAQRKLSELDDIICEHILTKLWIAPFPKKFNFPPGMKESEWKAVPPNRAAALALANRAQALLLAEQPEKALRVAKRATTADPSYVKGHFRVQRALEALGQDDEAAKKADTIRDYNVCRSMMPAEGPALLSAGWIDWESYALVWGPGRVDAVLSHLVEELPEDERRIEVRASLVPFLGGQVREQGSTAKAKHARPRQGMCTLTSFHSHTPSLFSLPFAMVLHRV